MFKGMPGPFLNDLFILFEHHDCEKEMEDKNRIIKTTCNT